MSLATSVDTPPDTRSILDTLDVSSLWKPAFPSPELVSAAAGLLTPLRRWDGCEGPRRRLRVAPGVVAVRSHDPARAERTAERASRARVVATNLDAQRILRGDDEPPAGVSRITSWSAKSRARMVRVLAELDYSPLFAEPGRLPAMVTLTYPATWEAVAPSPKVCKRHVDALRKRFARAWGRPLVGTWKREFQRRGAPHYHLLVVPPGGAVDGESFRDWLSRTWAEVVGAELCRLPWDESVAGCCEQHDHRRAGTGIDYAEGMRATDPKRLAVYFSKHGSYGAKEYQNQAPELWRDSGEGVGRFWGVWGLEPAVAEVEVTTVEALAAARTMRRWSRANGYVAPRSVWRWEQPRGDVGSIVLEGDHGDVVTGGRWRRRKVRRRVSRMPGSLGFVTVNDGPAFVSTLSRHLDAVRETAQRAELAALGCTDLGPVRGGFVAGLRWVDQRVVESVAL